MKTVAGWIVIAIGMITLPKAEAALSSHYAYTSERACLPSIRVLVAHDIPRANLEVTGSYNLQDPNEGTMLCRRLSGKQRVIEPFATGLRWGEEFPAIFQLQVLPSSPDTAVIVDGVTYRGNVTFYDVGGTLSIVHELPIEEFVLSQLANQSGHLPPEAMAALAIAARSQAYYYAEHPRNAFWDVDAMNTGYQGDEVGLTAPDVQRAVQNTRFMVLTQSPTGTEPGHVLPAKWSTEPANLAKGQHVLMTNAAVTQAADGADAAQILARTFPGAAIQRIDQQ